MLGGRGFATSAQRAQGLFRVSEYNKLTGRRAAIIVTMNTPEVKELLGKLQKGRPLCYEERLHTASAEGFFRNHYSAVKVKGARMPAPFAQAVSQMAQSKGVSLTMPPMQRKTVKAPETGNVETHGQTHDEGFQVVAKTRKGAAATRASSQTKTQSRRCRWEDQRCPDDCKFEGDPKWISQEEVVEGAVGIAFHRAEALAEKFPIASQGILAALIPTAWEELTEKAIGKQNAMVSSEDFRRFGGFVKKYGKQVNIPAIDTKNEEIFPKLAILINFCGVETKTASDGAIPNRITHKDLKDILIEQEKRWLEDANKVSLWPKIVKDGSSGVRAKLSEAFGIDTKVYGYKPSAETGAWQAIIKISKAKADELQLKACKQIWTARPIFREGEDDDKEFGRVWFIAEVGWSEAVREGYKLGLSFFGIIRSKGRLGIRTKTTDLASVREKILPAQERLPEKSLQLTVAYTAIVRGLPRDATKQEIAAQLEEGGITAIPIRDIPQQKGKKGKGKGGPPQWLIGLEDTDIKKYFTVGGKTVTISQPTKANSPTKTEAPAAKWWDAPPPTRSEEVISRISSDRFTELETKPLVPMDAEPQLEVQEQVQQNATQQQPADLNSDIAGAAPPNFW